MNLRSVARAAAIASFAALPWGCVDPNLKPAKMPEGGVRLSHDLRPGTRRTVDVHVEVTAAANAAQRIDAGGTWTAVGDDAERGGTVVRARFDRIELVWPEATDATEAKVTATDVNIHVRTGGAAVAEPPATGDAIADAVLGELGDAIAQSFVVAPPKPVKRADDWTWAPPAGTTGDLAAAVDGLFRTVDRDEEIAALDLRQRGRITEGAATSDFIANGRAWFATGGYVALFERAIEAGATTTKVRVRTRPS